MNDRNFKTAKILLLIPPAAAVLCVVCVIISIIPELSPYGALPGPEEVALGILFASPIPCLVMSVIGTVLAGKANKAGVTKAKTLYTLGIFEIFLSVSGILLGLLLLLFAWLGAHISV